MFHEFQIPVFTLTQKAFHALCWMSDRFAQAITKMPRTINLNFIFQTEDLVAFLSGLKPPDLSSCKPNLRVLNSHKQQNISNFLGEISAKVSKARAVAKAKAKAAKKLYNKI